MVKYTKIGIEVLLKLKYQSEISNIRFLEFNILQGYVVCIYKLRQNENRLNFGIGLFTLDVHNAF